jgi:RNA-directed DNA polymerase
MPTALQGRAQKAASQKGSRFRHRSGRLTEDFLKPCGRDIRKEAASGVEHGSAQASAPPLDAHIHGLGERRKPQRDRATRVRRHDMPTGDGPQRPLGMPAGEDTLRLRAVARRREALYAQDFLRCRDGARPEVGALDAVETLTLTLPCGR